MTWPANVPDEALDPLVMWPKGTVGDASTAGQDADGRWIRGRHELDQRLAAIRRIVGGGTAGGGGG